MTTQLGNACYKPTHTVHTHTHTRERERERERAGYTKTRKHKSNRLYRHGPCSPTSLSDPSSRRLRANTSFSPWKHTTSLSRVLQNRSNIKHQQSTIQPDSLDMTPQLGLHSSDTCPHCLRIPKAACDTALQHRTPCMANDICVYTQRSKSLC